MGIGIETGSTANTHRPGVEGSFGSTGKVRGTQGDAKIAVQPNPGPAATFNRSGEIKFQTAEGPGGEILVTVQTPPPTTPLSRIDLNA